MITTGSFLNHSKVHIVEPLNDLISSQNIGIAAATPIYKLQEILFSGEMVQLRKNYTESTPQ